MLVTDWCCKQLNGRCPKAKYFINSKNLMAPGALAGGGAICDSQDGPGSLALAQLSVGKGVKAPGEGG